MKALVMYHRYGCHLCDRMLEQLRPLQERYGFDLRVVDVDADEALVQRYDDKVPVLAGDGNELCRYHLNEGKIVAFLKSEVKTS